MKQFIVNISRNPIFFRQGLKIWIGTHPVKLAAFIYSTSMSCKARSSSKPNASPSPYCAA